MARSIETIYQEMLEAFAAQRGEGLRPGCDLAVRLYAAAAQVQALERQADWVLDQSFPQTAQGIYLDHHAQARGLSRGQALPAVGTLRFGRESDTAKPLVIKKDTVAMTADGRRFVTTKPVVMQVGQRTADVPAQAMEPGSAGNILAGAIQNMAEAPAGIAFCTNPEAFAGGTDREEDESLRQRILDSYRRLPNGANAAYYEQEAKAVAGVAAAKAVGRPRGVGTVDVYIAGTQGLPGEELLQQVQTRLQKQREIAVDLQVLAPTAVTVAVTAEISPAQGFTLEQAQVDAEAALRGKFTGRLLGRGLTTAELGNLLYSLDSVENIHLLAPTADIAGGETKLPVLGAVTIRRMGGV